MLVLMAVILVLILIFAITFIVFKIGFNRGYSSQCDIIKLNNQKVLSDREKLNIEIENQKINIDELSKRYLEKENLLESSLIKERNLKLKMIESEAQAVRNRYDTLYEDEKEFLEGCIQKEKDELDKLQRQKAATIEAFQREQFVKDNKDNYRLRLSKEDKADIEMLEDVRPKLYNPRILSMLIWQSFIQKKFKSLCTETLPHDKVCGVYKITNLSNDRCYIGQAKDINKRFAQHMKAACGIDTPQGNKLYNAMMEDGLDNFTFELIEECLPEELNEKENYYIQLYNSVNFGYNSQGGNIGQSNDS
jgi:hypothetical protein